MSSQQSDTTLAYPPEMIYDIETLIFECQPKSILLVGNSSSELLDNYRSQSKLLGSPCEVHCIDTSDIGTVSDLGNQFDLGIVLNCVEHMHKVDAFQLLAKLRDIHTRQYCLGLQLSETDNTKSDEQWQIADLYSLALKQVSAYAQGTGRFGLFKYKVQTYKSTPQWLNSENWANPENWGKYRW